MEGRACCQGLEATPDVFSETALVNVILRLVTSFSFIGAIYVVAGCSG